MHKKLVVEHIQGPLKGLLQILGSTEQLGLAEDQQPPGAAVVAFDGERSGVVNLIRTTPHCYLYREPHLPSGTLEESFHPQQL